MKERDVFIAALQQRDPAERAALLERACGGDHTLRVRVEELLREQEHLGSFLEQPAEGVAETRPFIPAAGEETLTSPCERSGTLIGPYELVQQIGEGGMGTVYLAQQSQPVKRLVALKVIRADLDSAQVVARFEAERQALALMDHPNIARVLDGGTTASGRPYFVMELVKGIALTKYCDEHHLTPRQRLELFVPVCRAVQHAHQKGIIHRDLKPSNVLVALCDGKPVPKVIDFGVAKAAAQQLTDKTLVSGSGDGTVRLWDTVPLAVRYEARREAAALRPDAEKLVERLFPEKKDAGAVVSALRADAALSESLRHAAFRAVLRRQAA
jgi:serine/threonine protein kinase